jgi:ribosome biogenesis GTPase
VQDNWGVEEVRALVEPRRTAALLGMSGVGKSTLVNALLGEDRQQTLPIRERDDRGRHATTRRELFELPGGGLLIDTPGLRLQRLAGGDGVTDAFTDVAALAAQCRFNDCTHTSEPGCAVLAGIESGELDPERLEAMRRLEGEARWAEERQGGPGEAARRDRGRAGSLAYRRAVEGKPDR